MFLTILEIVGVALVVLTVYYLCCTKFSRLGHSQAWIMIVASRLLVRLQWSCQRAASYLGALFERSLHFPGVPVGECFAGIAIVARLIILAVSSVVIDGEASSTLSAQSALWGTSSNYQLGAIELVSSAQFVATAALFGAILLECVGLIPASAALFVPMSKRLRWVVGVIAGLFTLISMLVIADFYIFKGVYLISPDSAQNMTIWILGGLGLISAAASIPALYGLVVGLCALFSVVVWLLEKGFAGTAVSLSLLPSILDVVAVHFSEGQRTTYEGYEPGLPWRVPNTWFDDRFSRRVKILAVPAAGDDDVTQPIAQLLPDIQKVSEAMKQPYKTAALVFVHTFGSRLFFVVKSAIELLGAAESILDTGLCDLSVSHINTAMPAIIDDSPSSDEKKAAIVHTGTQGAAYETLTGRLAAKLVEVHLQTKAAPAPLVFVIDKQCLSDCVPMLQEVKRRLPLHSVVVVTSIVQADLQNEKIVQGLKAMQALYRDEVVEKVIVLDARSPFALTHGEETQLSFAANACVSLLLTHKHNLNNMSGNELLKMVRPGGAFASFAFASEGLALGRVPTRLSFLPGLKERTGMGEIGDILLQSQAAIKRCVQDADCAAYPAAVDSTLPALVLVDVPVKVADSRFAEVVSSTSRFVNSTFPFASSAVVSGNGYTYPTDVSSRFNVQASLLFGLPSLLPEETLEEDDSGARVFTLVPLPTKNTPVPASTNGNGHKNGKVAARRVTRSRKNAGGK
ncbi:MAG: hypothetical protein ACRDIV_13900 [Ktedonobacteraceae bacterium]